MPGIFVAFEGGDGTGKSTQCKRLAEALRQRGFDVVETREPGGTTTGEAIRELLLGPQSVLLTATAEALLFAAARAQHAAEVIRPALAQGAIVVTDRYVDSSIAYQGVARGLGAEQIASLNAWATGGLQPDLTVLLDVSTEVGLRRAGEANRMEAEPAAFHESVRAALLERAAAAPDRYAVLNTSLPRGEVAGAILRRVEALLAALPRGADPMADSSERGSR